MTDILVVDDSSSRQELCTLLAEGPFSYLSVCEAATAQRALLLLKQEQPSIVLNDLALPDMDGIEFGRKVLELNPRTQVVALSHLQMFEVIYQAVNAGFSGYLLKPVVKSELFSLLERILRVNLMKDAMEQLRSQQHASSSPTDDEVDFGNPIVSVLNYINKYFAAPISLQEMAERVYLSPSYFSRQFKSEVGVTFTEYLTKFRIQKSKALLRVTSLPVEIVATNTGFSNASYFSTIFKRFEGRTPTEYRNLFSGLQ